MDHLCYLCLVFIMISRLSIDALWSSEGKGCGIRRRSPWVLEVHNVHWISGRQVSKSKTSQYRGNIKTGFLAAFKI